MNDDGRRVGLGLRIGNGVLALAVSVVLLGVLGAGAGSMPALGRMLVPGHGAWDWRFTLLPVITRPAAHIPALAGPASAGPAPARSGAGGADPGAVGPPRSLS
jgi:hypothetical protein